jgi:uncharacterized protein (DUF2461 family)
MAAEPKRFQSVLRSLERNGVAINRHEPLKRMPRGFEDQRDSVIAPYFLLGSFIVSEQLTDKDVMDRRLVDRAVELAKKSKPLLEYGWNVLMPR